MRLRGLILTVFSLLPGPAAAQDRIWSVDLVVGYAGFVDDATKRYPVADLAIRRYVTPRLSIGPELTVMANGDELRDRIIMLTGNATVDLVPAGDVITRVAPFLVGGIGIFRGRERFVRETFWTRDPAFTAGGGIRIRVSDRMSAAAEYRVGWELHQRFTGGAVLHW